LHDDPAAPTVTLHWYFTDQPFQTFPSVINCRNLDEEKWVERTLGEVANQQNTFEAPRIMGGLLGDHFCGEESDFVNGQPWPYTGPHPAYDPDGIPACCPRMWGWGPTAGGAAGGEGRVYCDSYSFTDPVYGPITVFRDDAPFGPDMLWGSAGYTPSSGWVMLSPHWFGVPGLWVVSRLATPGPNKNWGTQQTFFPDVFWDGRGTAGFHPVIPDAGPQMDVSCAD